MSNIEIFQSVEEYQHMFVGVDMDAIQLKRGNFINRHQVMVLPNLWVGYRNTQNAVSHHACNEPDHYYLIIPFDAVELYVDGKLIIDNKLFFISPNEETFSWFPHYSETLTFCFNTTAMKQHFDADEIAKINIQARALRNGDLPLHKLNEFKRFVRHYFKKLSLKSGDMSPVEKQQFEFMFFNALRELFSDILCSNASMSVNTRRDTVSRAIEYIGEYSDQRALPITELAKASCCSIRTLEYAFKSMLGVLPKSYLTHRKVNEVRQTILSGSFDSLTGVFEHFNITHPGRFSAQYSQQFGESPSVSLKRVTGNN
ncbi:helix-turn-helix domain-containing protein [Alteromonas sp. KUL49]|uniref:helix-turn-helix domain-containing protein n=1 Tax=Alteromonas sp. KUL49 TaxID=2480798 RepID=UPI00102EDAA5|nr:helix-turn-helix domain-containing protein [Alteromonas sp. KUL49]TAP38703.1 AraC family transcriptional regulator [Alteromonas sp. KUL49]